MNRHLRSATRRGSALVVALATAGLLTLTGCDQLPPELVDADPSASSSAGAGASTRDDGNLPDVCAMFSNAEITALTGRQVTQIDRDGAAPDAPTRHCQWQLSPGQLMIALSHQNPTDFQAQGGGDGEPVDALGEDAFHFSGHLYVLQDGVQLDVYAYGEATAQNRQVAERTAAAVLVKL